MSEHNTSVPENFGLEPEHLDGHTIEELAEYLDSGRAPANPSIDQSPGCLIALDALERLRTLSPALLVADVEAEPEPDEKWVQGVLAGIALDSRSGRRIPMPSIDPSADSGITEGAIRGLVRATENEFPGIIVGRVRLSGDVTNPGEPITVSAEVSIAHGLQIPPLAEQLREAIASCLATHTRLEVAAINIVVNGLHNTPRVEKATK